MNTNIWSVMVIGIIIIAFAIVVNDCNNQLHEGMDKWEQEMIESNKNIQRMKLEQQQRVDWERKNF